MEKNRLSPIAKDYALFKLASPYYDSLERTVGDCIKDHFRNFRFSRINVLEIGHGPGYTTEEVLKADSRTIVTAIDNDDEMIEQANQRLGDYIYQDRVKLVKYDGLQFLQDRFGKTAFDAFASGCTLHNFIGAYRNNLNYQIWRALKKGGLFVNLDKYAIDDETKHHESFQWQINMILREFGVMKRDDLIKYWINHYLEDNMPQRIMREGEAIKQMIEIGYKNPRIVRREYMDAVLVARK